MQDAGDVESLIKDSQFTDLGHKRKLKGQLFARLEELSPEDLEGVVGGVALGVQEGWEPWPVMEEREP